MSTQALVKETRHYMRIAVFVCAGLVAVPLCIFLYSIAAELMVSAEDVMPQQVTAVKISRSSAVITWHTTHPTQGSVEYGTTAESLSLIAPEGEPATDHRVELTLLNSSSPYYFQIRIGETVYDHQGLPWTFVTKSPSGEDVTQQVKGISTRIRSVLRPTATRTPTPAVCDVTSCSDIQKKLGKGCAVSDYVKCIALTPSRAVPTGTLQGLMTATPKVAANTTPAIQSSRCKPSYLYADASSTNKCSRWVWEREDSTGKPANCRDEFDHYELECKSNSFIPTPGATLAVEQQYFNGEISDMTHNSTSLDVIPEKGGYVFCQVRAVDSDGRSSDWFQSSAKCE